MRLPCRCPVGSSWGKRLALSRGAPAGDRVAAVPRGWFLKTGDCPGNVDGGRRNGPGRSPGELRRGRAQQRKGTGEAAEKHVVSAEKKGSGLGALWPRVSGQVVAPL